MKKILILTIISFFLNSFTFANDGLSESEKTQVNNLINGYLNKINTNLVATNLVKEKVSVLENKLNALKSNSQYASNQKIQDLVNYIGVSIDNWYASGDSKTLTLGYRLTDIAYSYNDFCKADKDGIVSCSKNTPPSDLGAVNKIVAGDNHFCALRKRDNSIECWGDNSKGQLNVPSGLDSVANISSAGDYTCAVSEDKDLYCWGDNKNGLLKVNESLDNIQKVYVGKNNICLLYKAKNSSKIKCYGDDTYGQVTDVNNPDYNMYSKLRYSDESYYENEVSIGNGHICFYNNCYGYNKFGQKIGLGMSIASENYTFNKMHLNIYGDFGNYWNEDLINNYFPGYYSVSRFYVKDDMICAFKNYDKTEGDKEKDGKVLCIKK